MTVSGIVFDLGSTLIRFDGDWSQVMAESRAYLAQQLTRDGFDLDEAAFSAALGKRLKDNMQRRLQDNIELPMSSLLRDTLSGFSLNGINNSQIDDLLQRMYTVSESHWHPVDGLHGVLDEIREGGFSMGIISNAADNQNVQRLIDKAGIREYFNPILVSAAVGIRKPDRRIFETLVKAWEKPPDELVMVGDSLRADIRGAQAAKMHQIWIKSFVDPEDLDLERWEVIPEAEVDALQDVPVTIRDLQEKG